MSWFKHTPPKHPPLKKHHSYPHRISPSTEKAKEEAKSTGPNKIKPSKTKSDK